MSCQPRVTLAAVFVVTLTLRLVGLSHAYDVFLDETAYTRIAAGVATNGKLFFAGFPFFLHPPAYFYLQGGLLSIIGVHGTAVHVVQELRVTNVVLASFTSLLVVLIVSWTSSLRWGLLAGLIFALDPFIIRFDSRVFLETCATLGLAAGYYLLLPLAGVPASLASHVRLRAAIAGGVFGLALLTKETSASMYVLPLLWCLTGRGPIARGSALMSLGAMVVTYLPYPLVVLATGGSDQFVHQKFDGVLRLVGAIQITGFNQAGAPSFLSRVTENLDFFAVTYLLIGVGALGALWLQRAGRPDQRLIGLWMLGACALLAYQMTRGTLEEQMFYYLVVPAIMVVGTAGPLVCARIPAPRRLLGAGVTIGLAVLAFDATAWAKVHLHRDLGMVRTVAWVERHVPAGSRVAPLADGSQFLLPRYVLQFDPAANHAVTPGALAAKRTQIVITSSTQIEQGYSTATPDLVRWLRARARPIYITSGRTTGTMTVWLLDNGLPASSPPGPQRLDPLEPLSED